MTNFSASKDLEATALRVFANATSKETGRRVIISPVSWKKIEDNKEKSPFTTSYDLDELICSSEEPSSSLQGLLNFLPGRLSQSRRGHCHVAE
jgi:hypothetical protein